MQLVWSEVSCCMTGTEQKSLFSRVLDQSDQSKTDLQCHSAPKLAKHMHVICA